MPLPAVNSDKLIAMQKYLGGQRILRNLNEEAEQLVISSACPPFDYVTGVGGLPRGKITEIYGAESTGKCLISETFVTLPGVGILRMDEIATMGDWGESEQPQKPDSHAALPRDLSVATLSPMADGTTPATHVYYPGVIPTTTVYTDQGHTTRGANDHRILILPENGIARWTTLQNARPGDVIFAITGARVAGSLTKILVSQEHRTDHAPYVFDTLEGYSLLGALVGVEQRQDALWLSTATAVQRKALREWSEKVGIQDPFEGTGKWTKFTGLLRPSQTLQDLASVAILPEVLRQIRMSTLERQQAWIVGLSLTKGQWTQNDLEIEIADAETARTFQAISENLGIRWTRFSTLNTFGDHRYKVALRSRIDQQTAEEFLWRGQQLPPTWAKKYAPEEDETHANVRQTLVLAKEILEKAGQSTRDFDIEDTTKENLRYVLGKIRPYARSRTSTRVAETLMLLSDERTSSDVVRGTEKSAPAPCFDLSVPIGNHYAANTLVSHNSTLALHLCKQELKNNPDAVCLYLDYERSTAKKYAQALGLLNYGPRFALTDPDSIEQADEVCRGLFQLEVFPSIIVVDSVAAATPQDMFNRDMEDTAPIGIKARKFSELLEKWVKIGGDYQTAFILINQTRTFIKTNKFQYRAGVPGIAGSDTEETPGGKAVKFYASLRIRLEVKKVVYSEIFNPMTGEVEKVPVANVVKAIAVKNKVAPPYKSGQFFIEFGRGLDNVRSMIEIAETKKLLHKGGGGNLSISLPSGRELKGRGDQALINALRSDAEAQKELMSALQWDNVEAVTSTVLNQVSVSVDGTPEDSEALLNAAAENAAMQGVTKSMVDQQPTLCHKAELLGLIDHPRANTYAFTMPGGEERRARTLDKLNGYLNPAEKKYLGERVLEAIERLSPPSSNPPSPSATVTTEPVPSGGENGNGSVHQDIPVDQEGLGEADAE